MQSRFWRITFLMLFLLGSLLGACGTSAGDVAKQSTLDAIKNLCIAHIENSIENGNMEFLFSPAPKEVWAEYTFPPGSSNTMS